MKWFKPTYYIRSFQSLPNDCLNHKKLILCDLDNTLVSHDEPLPSIVHHDFINMLKQQNIQFVIVSNNHKKRVQLFADALGVEFIDSTRKPLVFKVKRFLKKASVHPSETLFIGDQLLTDMLCANRLGIEGVLVQPVVDHDIVVTSFNRKFESIIFRHYEKKGVLKKGVFDGE